MRLDPDTGALESSAWRIEPREAQSSFASWAGEAGFVGRYNARADGWHVNVFFAIGGVLRHISMSLDVHPRKDQADAHQRWVDEQRWRGGQVYADWDKHYSDSNVYIEYETAASDGPPPEPGDLGLVARAARLDLVPGSPEYLAFERLWRQRPSDDALAEVVRTGTAAGRCYAAHLDPRAWKALLDDSSPLSVADAPLTTVADYARRWVA